MESTTSTTVAVTSATTPGRSPSCAVVRWGDPKYLELAKVIGLSRLGLIRHVILPQALHILWSGLRSSLGTTWSAHVDPRPS